MDPCGSGTPDITERIAPVEPPFACLWSDDAAVASRVALNRDDAVDVCIIGAGFTGLWTAWHLKQADPSIRVAVVEARHVGFGASGRNGGWVQTALPTSIAEIARSHGKSVALDVHREMVEAVDAIGTFAAVHAPKASFAHHGQLHVARSGAQAGRIREYVDEHRRLGLTDEDFQWLGPDDVRGLLSVTSPHGGFHTPHCAAINPRALVDGLASACEAAGVKIHENTCVHTIEPRRVVTSGGTVRAAFVVRATEGYTAELPGMRRWMLPVYSLMIATEPLGRDIWDDIGWSRRFTFSDARHMVIYAQRTSDDRIAFGGRGAPYQFGSKSDDAFADNVHVHHRLRETLIELFPRLSNVAVTHRWGGVLGVPRDWQASVGVNRSTGMAWAGGYVGDGVGATHLAGQTLADLIVGNETRRTRLPWVGHRSRRWEPEPLRILGVRAAERLTAAVDQAESGTARPRVRSWVLNRLM